jgi:hypothetical protein
VSTTSEITHVPQASKPMLESVKTFTLEKESMPSLSNLEKMDKSSVNVEEVKDLARKDNRFQTPSSTILPIAQEVTNQTSLTTTTLPVSVSTTQFITTTIQTTLPNNVSETTQQAETSEEKVDLIKHLNTSDLESFLQSANLTTREAQNFLRLAEKVSKFFIIIYN